MSTAPVRFVDRAARADADRALSQGLDMAVAASFASQDHGALDTAANARVIADLIEVAVAKLVQARRLYDARAEVR